MNKFQTIKASQLEVGNEFKTSSAKRKLFFITKISSGNWAPESAERMKDKIIFLNGCQQETLHKDQEVLILKKD